MYGNSVSVQSSVTGVQPDESSDFVFADTHKWLEEYAAICCSVVNSAAVSTTSSTNPAIRLPPDPKSIAEAEADPVYGDQWRSAIDKELKTSTCVVPLVQQLKTGTA